MVGGIGGYVREGGQRREEEYKWPIGNAEDSASRLKKSYFGRICQ